MKRNNEEAFRRLAEQQQHWKKIGLIPPTPEEARRDLQSEDPEVRKSAARALWKMGARGKEAIPELIEALDDEQSEVRGFAARALGKMKLTSPAAISLLIKALDDQQPVVRGYAARTLGQMGADAKEAVPALTEMLSDPTTYSVPVVVFEPGGDPGHRILIGGGDSYRQKGTHTVYVRANAAEALGRIGSATEEIVSALTGLLDDTQPSVRGSAARALGRIGAEGKPAIRALIQLLHDEADYHPETDAPTRISPTHTSTEASSGTI
jgi:HEAT repeat protein